MMTNKFRTPVECQNGHKAFWYWEIYGLGEVKNHGVPRNQKCNCPKYSLGEGYRRHGDNEQFTGYKDWYEGDLIEDNYGNTAVIIFDEYHHGFQAAAIMGGTVSGNLNTFNRKIGTIHDKEYEK